MIMLTVEACALLFTVTFYSVSLLSNFYPSSAEKMTYSLASLEIQDGVGSEFLDFRTFIIYQMRI